MIQITNVTENNYNGPGSVPTSVTKIFPYLLYVLSHIDLPISTPQTVKKLPGLFTFLTQKHGQIVSFTLLSEKHVNFMFIGQLNWL